MKPPSAASNTPRQWAPDLPLWVGWALEKALVNLVLLFLLSRR